MADFDAEKDFKTFDGRNGDYEITTTVNGEVVENTDQLHRKLGNRQIQLIAIGGSIGTAIFVSVGMPYLNILYRHVLLTINRHRTCSWRPRQFISSVCYLRLYAWIDQ